MTKPSLPVLYSFRRCPYAMRARLALAHSHIVCELREVDLKHKPDQLLALSPKGTVPVLLTAQGEVIDESLDIARWALAQHDPDNWFQSLLPEQHETLQTLIAHNDGTFKYFLDRYKYADRFPERAPEYYRLRGEETLALLETLLSQHGCLLRDSWTLADIALLPFIRQFAFVDKDWFDNAPYPHVRSWLDDFLDSTLFQSIMTRYVPWREGDEAILFPQGQRALTSVSDKS